MHWLTPRMLSRPKGRNSQTGCGIKIRIVESNVLENGRLGQGFAVVMNFADVRKYITTAIVHCREIEIPHDIKRRIDHKSCSKYSLKYPFRAM